MRHANVWFLHVEVFPVKISTPLIWKLRFGGIGAIDMQDDEKITGLGGQFAQCGA